MNHPSSEPRPGDRVAVIGSGISGLLSAYLLSRRYRVSLFEARDRLGGHAHTVDAQVDGRTLAVDTGFIVFNDRTYPTFNRLIAELDVAWREAPMTFGVRSDRSGLEYAVTTVNSLFAQRRNLVRLAYLRLLVDIARWNRLASRARGRRWAQVSLREWLASHRFSDGFVRDYLMPLGSAIWSCPNDRFVDFPVDFLTGFFHNHGMLSWAGQPQWRTIVGGSREYIDAMAQRWSAEVLLSTPVRRVRRRDAGVDVTDANGHTATFDHVIIAAHGDQALRMVAEPTPTERELLAAFAYQDNVATLHTDESILPRNRRAWAAWNYRVPAREADAVTLTYSMNRLQSLPVDTEVLVTINDTDQLDTAKVLGRWVYSHPLYTVETAAAQKRHHELICHDRISYTGAYWGYGFHEDGAASATRVTEAFGVRL